MDSAFYNVDVNFAHTVQLSVMPVRWGSHRHAPVYLRRELEVLGDAPVCLRDLIAVRLGLKCGLRPPEIRFQRADRIDFKGRVLYTAPCKNHPSRPVPVDLATLKLIEEYSTGEGVLLRAKEGYESRSNDHISDVLLFFIVKGAARVTGIPGWKQVYPYLLRHFFAANWVLKGGNMETLRRILGHDTLQSTQEYLARLVWWEDVQSEYEWIMEVESLGEERRNNIQVMKDILLAASSGNIKSHIVYGSNTNFKLFKQYVEKAQAKGLIEEKEGLWSITDRGREFVCRVLDLEAYLKEPM